MLCSFLVNNGACFLFFDKNKKRVSSSLLFDSPTRKELRVKLARRLPFMLAVVIFWATVRLSGVVLPITHFVSLGIIFASIAIIIFEFYKSGDITTLSFELDLGIALATFIQFGKNLGFCSIDLYVIFICATDAYVSSVNSYRT